METNKTINILSIRCDLLTREQALERGMKQHAGPYNTRMPEDLAMMERCLMDFRRSPNRRYAIVQSTYSYMNKAYHKPATVARAMIWADGWTSEARTAVETLRKRESFVMEKLWETR
jgi:hypothetical protein